MNSGLISTSDTITSFAESLSINIEVESLAIVDIFKGHLDYFSNRFNANLLLSTAAALTTEHSENIAHVRGSTTASLKTLQTIFVIDFSLLLVKQDVIGLLNFFELKRSHLVNTYLFRVTTFVGMMLDGELTISCLDFSHLSIFRNS